MLRIQFYPSGDNGPVRQYLEELRGNAQRKEAWAKLMRDLALLEAEGLRATGVSVQRIAGIPGSVWELRRSYGGIRYRVYFSVGKGEAWLLHSLEKRSPKIPRGDLRLIRTRAREVATR